ncbi:alpha/beta hydrolase family protein [Conexibacter arvalis]|uniref:Alpha-beta hydrolase superfamily lysophospholipase n=1 Tax=Conexibacter arvalis TaxID=912552 RepID=A0A840I8D7_9ACTN|nr:lipase family protein [Conexibacter arvalis]MBB4660513.1 alpha-beta hydrolase superfamily lysophospholipase [Conexibacter arvalis]
MSQPFGRVLALCLTLLAALLAAAVPAAAGDRSARPRFTGLLVDARRAHAAPSDVVAHRIKYTSTTTRGDLRLVSGLVLKPRGPAPRGGWPVVSWGHGTIGVADQCAPSRMDDYLSDPALLAFVRAGYVVAATDYEGLGTAGVHPYLIAESEARGMIDIVRAARILSPRASRSWFSVGHSQGGHAAIAAGGVASRYGFGNLDFKGTIAFAPVSDTSLLAYEIQDLSPFVRGLWTMILLGIQTQHPEIDLADHLGPTALSRLDVVRDGGCYLEAIEAMYDLPAEEFRASSTAAADQLAGWLHANAVPTEATTEPALILQGDADTTTPLEGTEWIQERACTMGWTSVLSVYPGARHLDIVDLGMSEALGWMQDRLDGRPAASDCP